MRQRKKMPCEDWNYILWAKDSQLVAKGLPVSTALLTTWFWSSSLWNCETIHFYCSKAPSSPYLVMASRWLSWVKNLPSMQEDRVWSLGWEDPLKEPWQPTPIFLPGGSQGQRSLVGYSPWGHTESDMTEWLTHNSRPRRLRQAQNCEGRERRYDWKPLQLGPGLYFRRQKWPENYGICPPSCWTMCYVLGKGDSTEHRQKQQLEKLQLFYEHAPLSSHCSISQQHTESGILCPPVAGELCQECSQTVCWLPWQCR